MPNLNDELNFILQCILLIATIWAWKLGEGWRLLAAVALLLSAVDALIDIPEFVASNNWTAAAVEVCWLLAGVGVVIYYAAAWHSYKQRRLLEHYQKRSC